MLLAATTLVLLSAPKLPLTGTYSVGYIAPGGKNVVRQPANTPPGAVRHLVIDKGQFELFDMMVGFAGTVKSSGRTVTMTFRVNPSGPMKKPDVVTFDASKDGKILTGRARKKGETRMVFTLVSAKPLIQISRKLPKS